MLSPNVLLIINSNKDSVNFKEIIKIIEDKIVQLWNSFTYYTAIKGIILANNNAPNKYLTYDPDGIASISEDVKNHVDYL